MPYLSIARGRLHLVRWQTPPTMQDIHLMEAEMRAARHRAGEKLLHCALVNADTTGSPAPEVRKEISQRNPLTLGIASAMYVAIEGSDLTTRLLRTVVRGMFLFSGQRGQMVLFARGQDAIRRACATLGEDAGAVVELASSKGLV